MASSENIICLEKKAWDYILEQRGNSLVLVVVCGSVGLYDVEVALSPVQVEHYHQRGTLYLDELAAEIRNSH